MEKKRSKKLSRKKQVSSGYKRWINLSIVIFFGLFILVSNLIAGGPKEHEAGVTFLGNADLLPALLKDIDLSTTEIKCALYMFKTDGAADAPTSVLLAAILDAAGRGVKVSILMDTATKDDISTQYNTHTGKVLAMAGAEVFYDDPERRLHAKMCIIDRNISFIGSHNYTYSAFQLNSEVTVRVRSTEIAAEALRYLNELGVY